MATSTPWGMSQYSEKIAVGIMEYGTASHGGIHLSNKRNDLVPDYMRNANAWYEEDCEWAIVACVFPDEYAAYYEAHLPDIIETAKRMLRHYMPDMFEQFFGEEILAGQSTIRDKENFYKDHADDYIVVSAITSDEHEGMVKCFATKGGSRKIPEWDNGENFLVAKDEYTKRNQFGFVIDETKHKITSAF